MHTNEEDRIRMQDIIDNVLPRLFSIEGDYYFSICGLGYDVGIQARTQVAVREVRKAFPGVIWKKEEYSGSWMYDGNYNGCRIHIYGCDEAPPTCKVIMKTRTVTKQVPVEFREETVEETYIAGYDCGQGTEEENTNDSHLTIL